MPAGSWQLRRRHTHPKHDELTCVVNAQFDLVLVGKKDVPTMITDADAELQTVLSRASA